MVRKLLFYFQRCFDLKCPMIVVCWTLELCKAHFVIRISKRTEEFEPLKANELISSLPVWIPYKNNSFWDDTLLIYTIN